MYLVEDCVAPRRRSARLSEVSRSFRISSSSFPVSFVRLPRGPSCWTAPSRAHRPSKAGAYTEFLRQFWPSGPWRAVHSVVSTFWSVSIGFHPCSSPWLDPCQWLRRWRPCCSLESIVHVSFGNYFTLPPSPVYRAKWYVWLLRHPTSDTM